MSRFLIVSNNWYDIPKMYQEYNSMWKNAWKYQPAWSFLCSSAHSVTQSACSIPCINRWYYWIVIYWRDISKNEFIHFYFYKTRKEYIWLISLFVPIQFVITLYLSKKYARYRWLSAGLQSIASALELLQSCAKPSMSGNNLESIDMWRSCISCTGLSELLR